MKPFVIAAVATLLLSSCTWQTNRALLPDDPDDKAIHTGSHIPVKETVGKASTTADADAMMRNQKALGGPAGTRGN
jgi:outer membrane biogenesis lipoprotein LolB